MYCTGESFFKIRTTKMLPWICCFLFQKYIFGIWDWGSANSFWDHVIQNSMTFQNIVSQIWKVTFFAETFAPYNEILIFEVTYVCPIWVLYLIPTTLIKKKTDFSSYIRKFRWDRVQSHIWRRASQYMKKCANFSLYIK